jgi:hypothetical protein
MPLDFSKNTPITAPKTITIPILDRVCPNPVVIKTTRSEGETPKHRPENIAAISNIKKGSIFNLSVPVIISKTAKQIINKLIMKEI